MIAATVSVARCHKGKVHDNASTAASVLTKHKAKELAANPSALIHEALDLVRRRRSVDATYDDHMDRIKRDKIPKMARKRLLEEELTGEEKEHTIDKRQISDDLDVLHEYMAADTGSLGLQQIVTGIQNEAKVNKRVKKELRENVRSKDT